jgi:hypothetical protein
MSRIRQRRIEEEGGGVKEGVLQTRDGGQKTEDGGWRTEAAASKQASLPKQDIALKSQNSSKVSIDMQTAVRAQITQESLENAYTKVKIYSRTVGRSW